MKKLISVILLSVIFSNMVMADDCPQFAKGVTPGPNNTFVYSQACHERVGKLLQDDQTKDQQITDYKKAIDLKDLALTKADQRTQLWENTADQEQDRLSKVENDQKFNAWLYFGLGVLTTFAAGFVTAKLTGR